MLTMAEKAARALRIVREAPVIAFDTETSGLNRHVNNPVGYVITESADENYYIPVRHGGGGNLSDPNAPPLSAPDDPNGFKTHAFERDLAAAFKERVRLGYLTVGHNLKFDKHMSANHGIDIGRDVVDTQITEGLLDEYARGFGLDDCATRHGVTAKKGDELYEHMAKLFGGKPERAQMEHYWKLSGVDELGVDYALGDGVSTLELYHSQMEKIRQPDARGFDLTYIHNLESQLIHTVFRMEQRGMKVDFDRIEKVRGELSAMLFEAKKKVPNNLNTRSSKQMREYMESLGRTDWPTTDLGNPQFNEKWLKSFPEGQAIVRVRQINNLVSSFLDPLVERHTINGRVYASLNQTKIDEYGTISGRFSCSDPNLQQVPKRNKELAKLFRSIFIRDFGFLFYEADYSQCEPRLFAHYSRDPNLVAGYLQTPFRDAHQVVADMLNVERDPTAKRMNMGIFTGMYPKTFAGHMGTDLQTATAWWNMWHDAFPGVKAFQDTAKEVILDHGHVRTILGRRCRLDNERYAYRAVSKIIQGSNADIVKLKLLESDQYLESIGDAAFLMMTIHDSFNYQCPEGDEGAAINKNLIRIWEDVRTPPINLRVPFVIEDGCGLSWAEATFGA